MDALRLSVEQEPDAQEVEQLAAGLYAYNAAQTGQDDGQALAVFLRDAAGQVVGGAAGHTWCGCLEVKLLWVAEGLRHQGYGTQLLAAIEQAARARGCHTAMLDTYAFQAPDFYPKLGYTVYGTLEDPQTGVQKVFFKRALA
jgi:GNAT superfamily N-acetyltransferase